MGDEASFVHKNADRVLAESILTHSHGLTLLFLSFLLTQVLLQMCFSWTYGVSLNIEQPVSSGISRSRVVVLETSHAAIQMSHEKENFELNAMAWISSTYI